MSVTYREMINRVLRAVSEDEIPDNVDTLDDDYHKLIGVFVNIIREEVEASNTLGWRSLQQTIVVPVSAGFATATIPGANERSKLVRLHESNNGRLIPLVFDTTDAGRPVNLKEIKLAEWRYRSIMDSGESTGASTYFAIDDTSGDEVQIKLSPSSTSARTLQVTMAIPQERFGPSDLDVVIKVPTTPVEMGAIWYALEERGEELGQNGIFTEERYRNALDAAVSRDLDEQGGLEMVPV